MSISKGHLTNVFREYNLGGMLDCGLVLIDSKLTIWVGTKHKHFALICDKAREVFTTFYLGYNIIGGVLRKYSLRGKDLLMMLHTLTAFSFEIGSPREYLSFVWEYQVVSITSSDLLDSDLHVLCFLDEQRRRGEPQLSIVESELPKFIWTDRE